MLSSILEDRADVVCGSRFLDGAPVTTRWHRTANRGMTDRKVCVAVGPP
jgi:hypothetical protein